MTVKVLSDEVTILGPDGVAVSLTADSAAASAKRLSAAAEQIREGDGDVENGTEDAPETPAED